MSPRCASLAVMVSGLLGFVEVGIAAEEVAPSPRIEEIANHPIELSARGARRFPVWPIGESYLLWRDCREEGFRQSGWPELYELSKDGGVTWEPLTEESSAGCQFDWLIGLQPGVEPVWGPADQLGASEAPRPIRKPYDMNFGFDRVGDTRVATFDGKWAWSEDTGLMGEAYGGEDALGAAFTLDARNAFDVTGLDITLTGGAGRSDPEVDFGRYGEHDVRMHQYSGGALFSYDFDPSDEGVKRLKGVGFRFAGNESDGDDERLSVLVDTPRGIERHTAKFGVSGGRQWKSELAALSKQGASLSLSQERFDDPVDSDNDLDSGFTAMLGAHNRLGAFPLNYDLDAGYAFESDDFVYDATASLNLFGGIAGARLADQPLGRERELFFSYSCFGLELFDRSGGAMDDTGFMVSFNPSCRTQVPQGLGIGRSLATDLSQRFRDRDRRIAAPVRGAGSRGLIMAASRPVRTELKTETVELVEPRNQAPVAVIGGVPASVVAGQRFTADGSGSSDAEGPIAAYAWSAGGVCSLVGGSTGSTATVAVSATAQPGAVCNVGLTVTDSAGETGSASAQATVGNQAPVAVISGIPATLTVGQQFTADGSGSSDAEGPIAAYAWSSGGACALAGAATGTTAQFVVSTNAQPGDLCTVGLTVTDSAGATGSASVQASIGNQPPTAVITGVPATVVIGQQLTADGSGSSDAEGPIAGYAWSASGACSVVGAATESTASIEISRTVQPGAVCTVGLTVTDGSGATASASAQSVVENQPPVAVISGVPSSVAPGSSFFADGGQSSDLEGPIAAYGWNAGGVCSLVGSASASQAEVFVDPDAQVGDPCTVALTVTDSAGATDSETIQTAVANQPPIAVIETPTSTPTGSGILFGLDGSASSDAEGPIASYFWTASGDCSLIGEPNAPTVQVFVNSPGSCAVELTVTDQDGVTDTASTTLP